MAKSKVKSNKPVEAKPKKTSYDIFKDPGETILGKIIVGLIIFGTVAGIFVGAVIAVIEYFK